MLLYMRTCFIA